MLLHPGVSQHTAVGEVDDGGNERISQTRQSMLGIFLCPQLRHKDDEEWREDIKTSESCRS